MGKGSGKSSQPPTWPKTATRRLAAVLVSSTGWWADPVGALAMLPVILWQGWETLEEARDLDY
jgi:hypothetical protein